MAYGAQVQGDKALYGTVELFEDGLGAVAANDGRLEELRTTCLFVMEVLSWKIVVDEP